MKAEDYFIMSAECVSSSIGFSELILESIKSNCKWFVLEENDKIIGCVRRDSLYEKLKNSGFSEIDSIVFDDIIVEAHVVNSDEKSKEIYEEQKIVIVKDEKGGIKGVIDWELDPKIHELVSNDRWLIKELQTVFHEFYHNIFVTDEKGKVIRVTAKDDQHYLGRNVVELEKERAFYPSVTAKVLNSGKREKSLQYTQSGEVYMIESIPIKNDEGDIVRIVSITKDTSEVSQLTSQLDNLRSLLDSYQREVVRFQHEKMEKKPFIFKSETMKNLYEQVQSVSSVDTSVLILGETGVGKEMVANQIHLLSNRHNHPFIAINCGAVPETLLESELFGYEEGAFSGARKGGKLGIFELADKGTVFLDEIGEMPLQHQVKLLRVLQEKKVMKIGGNKEKKVDVRIIAATNKNLKQMVKEKTFREDLYYRINIIPIQIPPLRERTEDIHALTFYFLSNLNQKYIKKAEIEQLHLDQMLRYSWPGNVRELENMVERFVVTGKTPFSNDYVEDTISLDQIDKEWTEPINLIETVEKIEKKILQRASVKCKTTRELAKFLGLNQSTIVRKLKKYNL